MLAAEDDAGSGGTLAVQDVAQEIATGALAMGPSLAQQRFGARCDIGVGVDLPVRVVQGHPDLLPAVLEAEHLLDSR